MLFLAGVGAGLAGQSACLTSREAARHQCLEAPDQAGLITICTRYLAVCLLLAWSVFIWCAWMRCANKCIPVYQNLELFFAICRVYHISCHISCFWLNKKCAREPQTKYRRTKQHQQATRHVKGKISIEYVALRQMLLSTPLLHLNLKNDILLYLYMTRQ